MVTEKQMQDESHIRRVLSKTDANTIASLTAEVERYKADEDGWKREIDRLVKLCGDQEERASSAEAQVEKLRAALEPCPGLLEHAYRGVSSVSADKARAVAATIRTALQSTEGDIGKPR